MNEKKKKSALILILVIASLFAIIFIAGKTNIREFITPTYKLASTPYASLNYIGNGTAKVGGLEAMEFLQIEKNDNLISYTDIYFPYSNITIDNKTFAVVNESISFNSNLQEIKQKIPLYDLASNNGTLYYVRLINFSNYYGIIIPANFMNKSNIAIPFIINPYPSCPIIPAVSNPNDIVFNNLYTDFIFPNLEISSIYAYTGVIILKNTTGIVGSNQYSECVTINEQMPSFGVSVCSVNNVDLNCTYFNNYGKWINENPVYPQIKVINETSIINKNETITSISIV